MRIKTVLILFAKTEPDYDNELAIQICTHVRNEGVLPYFASLSPYDTLWEEIPDTTKFFTETLINELVRRQFFDEVWLFGKSISKDMSKLIELAEKMNIPILSQSEDIVISPLH